ncbi:unnamed protein product [Urochloa humidicola]
MATAAVAQEQQQQRAGAGSTSHPPTRLQILHTTIVPPSSGSAPPPECSLPLTVFDIPWLHFPPVERLFLYRLAPDADVPAILSNLKDALSHALRDFYPLAGRLRLTPGTANRYELHYSPGDRVAFTVVAGDVGADGVDGLATDDPREVSRIAPLVPPLPKGGAVLAIQATVLPDRRGLAIGVAVDHAAADGATSTRFLHAWAAAACARADTAPSLPSPLPVIDRRSLLSDAFLFFQATPTPTNSANEVVLAEVPANQLLATFTLSSDDVRRAKDAVAAEAARRGVAPPRCTSLIATLGLVWSCYHRAKAAMPPLPSPSSTPTATAGGGDGRTCLLFSVDHRTRTSPPLPGTYLGNCVRLAFALAPKAALAAGGAGGLLSACAAVAVAVDEAVSGGVGTGTMDTWGNRFKEVAGTMGILLSVAGSPRFRVYELDMGFGRPAKVDIVSVARTGAVAVAESRRGGGGMEVGVPLPPDDMKRFRECFADAVAGLHAPS